jgi:hypothetical protein
LVAPPGPASPQGIAPPKLEVGNCRVRCVRGSTGNRDRMLGGSSVWGPLTLDPCGPQARDTPRLPLLVQPVPNPPPGQV